MKTRHLAILIAFQIASCSTVPPLSTEPGKGPSVAQVTNHINCELANIADDVDDKLVYRESQDPSLRHLIPYLKKYHFVASILMTVDTLDSEGISPSSSFIHPFSTAFSRAIGLGGQLSGSQERNSFVGYSIDLDNVGKGCVPETQSPREWLNGTLNLADIVADGLAGLDSTSLVNVYGSGGPAVPAYDATLENLKLHGEPLGAPATPPGAPTSPPGAPAFQFGARTIPPPQTVNLNLNGSLNFAPSSDALQSGSVSFNGSATVKFDDGEEALQPLTMTGNLVSYSDDPKKSKKGIQHFSLSGTLNPAKITRANYALQGLPSTLSLVGEIQSDENQRATKLADITGMYTAGELPYKFILTGPQTVSLSSPHNTEHENFVVYTENLTAPIGGAPASAPVTVKNAAASQATSSQFGSTITFGLTYGLNGGPNWTLSTFKGPAAGSANLLSATRTQTATLQITFVPACQKYNDRAVFHSLWEAIPKCNGSQVIAAANQGQGLNYLQARGVPGL